MLNRFYLTLFAFLLSFFIVSGANVSVNVNGIESAIVFDYQFSFSDDESYNSFSFEKPRDAKIVYATDSSTNESVPYSIAGDYFIFKPEDIEGKTFKIKFTSREKYSEIFEKNTFSIYANFNFPVENFQFYFDTKNIGEVREAFPRNYLIENGDVISWRLNNISSDTLFLINFEENVQNGNGYFDLNQYLWIIILAIVLVLLFITGFVFGRKYFTTKPEKPRKSSAGDEVKADSEDNLEMVESDEEEKFENIINKYLTENEKEVVDIVKENPGISQYDILNFIPTLTKSNLSKIISKLHSRRILNRIRVGKVNKIYLGEKLGGSSVEETR